MTAAAANKSKEKIKIITIFLVVDWGGLSSVYSSLIYSKDGPFWPLNLSALFLRGLTC
jgi:hypothetical protein